MASYVTQKTYPNPWPEKGEPEYSKTEEPAEALTNALAYWGEPLLRTESQGCIAAIRAVLSATKLEKWEASSSRALRQNALRMVIATAPDMQVS